MLVSTAPPSARAESTTHSIERPRPDRHLAPAWSGDLSGLTDEQLDQRIQHLAVHIGNYSTVYELNGTWRAAADADLSAREVPRWVSARLDALRERERRLG